MSDFFITNNGRLVEVITYITAIQSFTPCGPITQPQMNREFKDRGQATEEDRQRIPQALGGYA